MSRGGVRLGAGRPSNKGKAEDYRRVDVRQLAREGMLKEGPWACRWVGREGGRALATLLVEPLGQLVDLTYREGPSTVTSKVSLTWTACHLGGERCWFRCPCCGRRVALLLLEWARIACNRCVATTYRTQRVDVCGRTWIKQRKLEGRLGPGLARPAGMSTEIYSRILVGIRSCQRRRASWLASAMAPVTGQLVDLHWQVYAHTRGFA
jgi:hypothetical protein